MASSTPGAVAALHAILAALQATTLAGVAVEPFGIWQEITEADSVIVKQPAPIDRAPRLGLRRFDEDYSIPVEVTAVKSGHDLFAVNARAWAIVTIVEQAVMANPTLTGTVVSAYPGGVSEGNTGLTDETRSAATLTLQIVVNANVALT